MDAWAWDIRHALRGLWRAPGFTALAVVTLALGIGANTAIFSLLDEVFLRPLPVHAPEELTELISQSGTYVGKDFSYFEYQDLARAGTHPVLASSVMSCALGMGDEAVHSYGEQVSGNYFSVLGVPMFLGRPLTALDDRAGAPPAVVLGYDLWRTRFGADPAVVGKPARLDRVTATVAGVAKPGFRGRLRGFPASFWVPLHVGTVITGDDQALVSPNMRWLTLIARIPSDARISAKPQLEHAYHLADPQGTKDAHLVLRPASRGDLSLLEGPGRLSRLLMALVVILLTIACANVAGLLLARTEARRREIAIRLALGSSAGRVARQFLAESMLLSVIGGALGLLVATWTLHVLEAFTPGSGLPTELRYRLDAPVLLFTLGVTLVSGIAFGLAPALQTRRLDLSTALKRDAGSGWWSRRRLEPRRLLVAGQVALAVVLLTAAGLFLRTLWNERAVPLGFDPKDRLAISFNLGAAELDPQRASIFYRDLLDRVRALPGVRSAALAQYIPVSPGGSNWGFPAGGLALPYSPAIEIDVNGVGDDYFRTLRIPIVRGREFTAAETTAPRSAPKAVVNRTLAERLWPGQDPIGKLLPLRGADQPPYEIVGLVENARYRGIRGGERPYLYVSSPLRQSRDLALIVHADQGAGGLFAAIRTIAAEVNPRVALFAPTTLAQHVDQAMVVSRFGAMLMGAFGLLALGLTCLGLYGVLAFAVTRRTREIGLRLAFGATPARVLRMIVAESVTIAVPGFLAGAALALLVSRLATSLLYGVSPTDPWTYGAMLALMLSALLAAAWLPGRRAARLEPMVALREE